MPEFRSISEARFVCSRSHAGPASLSGSPPPLSPLGRLATRHGGSRLGREATRTRTRTRACLSRLAQVQVQVQVQPSRWSRRRLSSRPLAAPRVTRRFSSTPPPIPPPLVPLAPRGRDDIDAGSSERSAQGVPHRMLEQDDGRQGGEEHGAGRGVPRRAAGAGSGGGRDVAGGGARLLRPRHRRALLRRVPPPLQARRGVLAAGRGPATTAAATSGEGAASIDARAALEHLQMQRIFDFVHIR
ncbi:hypothetical protein PVAP13_2NG399403 [Panicum virgatum]|uniref:Uncharacterized protein n=1 Tax=Panicum virgatum TaxID=38727 RepID=A0A8T0VH98_PANVG|nr:hypothetical protein PVAP13_2NG399403 [Panicum virgatum]